MLALFSLGKLLLLEGRGFCYSFLFYHKIVSFCIQKCFFWEVLSSVKDFNINKIYKVGGD